MERIKIYKRHRRRMLLNRKAYPYQQDTGQTVLLPDPVFYGNTIRTENLNILK